MVNSAPEIAPAGLTERQHEILDRAVELLREQGLPGLTVRRLAERMGFSEAALYRHFASKEELLIALLGRLAEQRLLGPIRRIAADQERPPGERLEAIVDHQLTTLAELEGVPILFVAEALATGDQRLLERARGVLGEVIATLGSLVRQLPSEPGAPPAEALVFALFGLGAGTALRFRLARDAAEQPDPAALRRLGRQVVRRLVGPAGGDTRGGP
jgi:AcrR family transcriptional regulator